MVKELKNVKLGDIIQIEYNQHISKGGIKEGNYMLTTIGYVYSQYEKGDKFVQLSNVKPQKMYLFSPDKKLIEGRRNKELYRRFCVRYCLITGPFYLNKIESYKILKKG